MIRTILATAIGVEIVAYGLLATVAAWADRPTVIWSDYHQRWIAARSQHRIAP